MNIIYSVSFLLLLVANCQVLAEYDSEKMGEAIGQYITPVWLIDRLGDSECSYLFKGKKTFNLL